jgi:hypothetical protein
MLLVSNNLSGTVPSSWAHFSTAKVDLWNNTMIEGCAPDGVLVRVCEKTATEACPSDEWMAPCGKNSSEVQGLLRLYDLLKSATWGTSAGKQPLSSWALGAGDAGEWRDLGCTIVR